MYWYRERNGGLQRTVTFQGLRVNWNFWGLCPVCQIPLFSVSLICSCLRLSPEGDRNFWKGHQLFEAWKWVGQVFGVAAAVGVGVPVHLPSCPAVTSSLDIWFWGESARPMPHRTCGVLGRRLDSVRRQNHSPCPESPCTLHG